MLDEAMVTWERSIDLTEDRLMSPTPVRFEVNGATISARFERTGRANSLQILSTNNDPAALREFFNVFGLDMPDPTRSEEDITREMAQAFPPGFMHHLNIETSKRVSPDHAMVGWLRTAYLVAFAALGYTYIFPEESQVVRIQIAGADPQLAPIFHSWQSDADLNVRDISILNHRTGVSSVLVTIGRHAVFLPASEGFYDEFPRIFDGSIRLGTDWKVERLPWPVEPAYRWDFSGERRVVITGLTPGEHDQRGHGMFRDSGRKNSLFKFTEKEDAPKDSLLG